MLHSSHTLLSIKVWASLLEVPSNTCKRSTACRISLQGNSLAFLITSRSMAEWWIREPWWLMVCCHKSGFRKPDSLYRGLAQYVIDKAQHSYPGYPSTAPKGSVKVSNRGCHPNLNTAHQCVLKESRGARGSLRIRSRFKSLYTGWVGIPGIRRCILPQAFHQPPLHWLPRSDLQG